MVRVEPAGAPRNDLRGHRIHDLRRWDYEQRDGVFTIGTPQDVTADELRVEAFFPANPATEKFFRAVAS